MPKCILTKVLRVEKKQCGLGSTLLSKIGIKCYPAITLAGTHVKMVIIYDRLYTIFNCSRFAIYGVFHLKESHDPISVYLNTTKNLQMTFVNFVPALALKAPIATKVICISRLLKCLWSLYDKQCGPDKTAPIGAVWSGSTLFASILKLIINVWQLFAADDFSRRHFSDAFFLGTLRVRKLNKTWYFVWIVFRQTANNSK